MIEVRLIYNFSTNNIGVEVNIDPLAPAYIKKIFEREKDTFNICMQESLTPYYTECVDAKTFTGMSTAIYGAVRNFLSKHHVSESIAGQLKVYNNITESYIPTERKGEGNYEETKFIRQEN